jgi:hypothetical protein
MTQAEIMDKVIHISSIAIPSVLGGVIGGIFGGGVIGPLLNDYLTRRRAKEEREVQKAVKTGNP